MKKIITISMILFSMVSFAQTNSADRDSVAQTSAFQKKVQMATLIAANNLLADPSQAVRIRQYSQLIISAPLGEGWLLALSFGCLTNPAINYDSSDGDIQFTVNSLFAKYAYAYYRDVQP